MIGCFLIAHYFSMKLFNFSLLFLFSRSKPSWLCLNLFKEELLPVWLARTQRCLFSISVFVIKVYCKLFNLFCHLECRGKWLSDCAHVCVQRVIGWMNRWVGEWVFVNTQIHSACVNHFVKTGSWDKEWNWAKGNEKRGMRNDEREMVKEWDMRNSN